MARRTFRRSGYAAEEDGGVVVVDTDEDERVHEGDTPIVIESSGDDREDTISDSYETVSGERIIDPSQLRGTGLSGEVVRRRGRKVGSKNKSKSKTFQESNLEKLLLSLHLIGATILKTPELAIDEKESAMLSKAMLDVFAAYGIPEMSDKTMAGIQLTGAIIAVYGTRTVAILRKHPKPAKLVTPMGSVPASPNPYVDAAKQTQQAAQQVAQQPSTQTVIRPNGSGYVQSVVSPFGDQDGTSV